MPPSSKPSDDTDEPGTIEPGGPWEPGTLDAGSIEPRDPQPFVIHIEAGKLAEFARATRGPVVPDGPFPATFLMTDAFWKGPDAEVIDHTEHFDRTLHASQEFLFPGPLPRVGAILNGRSRLGGVIEKVGRRGGQMTFTEVLTDYRDEQGRLVATSVSSTVVVASRPAGQPA